MIVVYILCVEEPAVMQLVQMAQYVAGTHVEHQLAVAKHGQVVETQPAVVSPIVHV